MKFSFTKKDIRSISDKLRHKETLSENEEQIFSAFREGHNDILNNYQSVIRRRLTKSKYKDVVFVQRLKRRPTIVNKLSERLYQMDLSRMHDIAGGRIIFPNLVLLNEFRNEFLKGQKQAKKFHRIKEGKYNYIDSPNKKTGYRGIHDIFEEVSADALKVKIEIQYRTQIQHAWATACEIWDSNFGDLTKFGLSDPKIQKFFCLISEFFSRMLESSQFTNKSDISIYAQILFLECKYDILSKLRGLNILKIASKNLPQNKQMEHELLLVVKKVKETSVDFAIYEHIYNAMPSYSKIELHDDNDDSVLVKVKNRKELKAAYNNYFNDMRAFFLCWQKARGAFYKKHPVAARILDWVLPVYRDLTPKEKELFEQSKLKHDNK